MAVFIKFQYFTTVLDKTTILIWFQSELLNFSFGKVSIYSYQYRAVLFGRPGRVCSKNTVVTDLFTLQTVFADFFMIFLHLKYFQKKYENEFEYLKVLEKQYIFKKANYLKGGKWNTSYDFSCLGLLWHRYADVFHKFFPSLAACKIKFRGILNFVMPWREAI